MIETRASCSLYHPRPSPGVAYGIQGVPVSRRDGGVPARTIGTVGDVRHAVLHGGRGVGCEEIGGQPQFLGLGVQYFRSTVGRLIQQSSDAYLKTMRQAAADAGK